MEEFEKQMNREFEKRLEGFRTLTTTTCYDTT